MRTNPVTKILAALFAALLLLGACSSDSDDSADDTTTTQESSDDTSDETSDDTSDDTLDIGDLSGIGDDCLEFAAAYSSTFAAFGAVFAGVSDAEVEEYQEQLEDLGASVPDEIADDFNTMVDAYSALFTAMAENGLTSSEVIDATEALDSDEVSAAEDAVQAYLDAECG